MTIDIKTFRAEAQAFAKKHLAECAAEIIEWQDTAILRDGRVRELAAKCGKFIENHDSLRVAESFISRAAVERAATIPPATPDAADWQLVPKVPTDDMIVSFAEVWYSKVRCFDDCEMEDAYAAMLAAAPAAGVVEGQAEATSGQGAKS